MGTKAGVWKKQLACADPSCFLYKATAHLLCSVLPVHVEALPAAAVDICEVPLSARPVTHGQNVEIAVARHRTFQLVLQSPRILRTSHY